MTTKMRSETSEIVIGFVGPVGVEHAHFVGAAARRLSGFRYHPTIIRLSECLDELHGDGILSTKLVADPEFDRIRTHMDAGDELRSLNLPGARGLLAAVAVAKIAVERERYPEERKTRPLPRNAWLISSLKNPAEVEMFRRVYGPGFFLVGLFATEEERRRALERGMSPDEATKLILRDAESEEKHGQQTRRTFELADAWVRSEDQLCRFLDLVFGNTFQTPNDDEDGMALAYTSALRSADLSRQVGAVIISATGEVIATGRNEAPAPGGGQYSAPSKGRPTARDCDVGQDSNTKERLRLEMAIADAVEGHLRPELEELAASLGTPQKAKLQHKLGRLRTMCSGSSRPKRRQGFCLQRRRIWKKRSRLRAPSRTCGS